MSEKADEIIILIKDLVNNVSLTDKEKAKDLLKISTELESIIDSIYDSNNLEEDEDDFYFDDGDNDNDD